METIEKTEFGLIKITTKTMETESVIYSLNDLREMLASEEQRRDALQACVDKIKSWLVEAEALGLGDPNVV